MLLSIQAHWVGWFLKIQNQLLRGIPNIVIANVEKDGIRDSRNQEEYSRFSGN